MLTDRQIRVGTAMSFAMGAHGAINQKRKYTGDDYIVHPIQVAEYVEQVDGVTDTMLMAAMLHDVVEDTGVDIDTIEDLFGEEVATYVAHLTDEFTSEAYPDMNRAARKAAEADRYSRVPNEVKTIKLADGIDNTASIIEFDQKFLKTYGPEKRRLLESLRGGDKALWVHLSDMLEEAGY